MPAFPFITSTVATKNIYKKMAGFGFFKNVFVLMSGNVIGQAINLGTAPALTRLFSPENFGLMALFLAIVSIISGVGTLCYERAILLPKKNKEAINVFFLSFVLLLVICCIVLLAVFFFGRGISKLVGNPDFSFWIMFVPLGVLLTGLANIMRYWRLRNEHFKSIAISRISGNFAAAAAKISAGLLFGAFAGGLIGGAMLGIFITVILLILIPTKCNLKEQFRDVSQKIMISMARTYKKFPCFASWNALLNIFSQNLAIFVLSFFFTPAIVGFYSLANRVLSQPISLLSESVRNAYFQKSAQQLSKQEAVMPGLRKITMSLMIIGAIPFFILLFFGKSLFETVFGYGWETSGAYVQIMAPWFFFLFISAPTKVLFDVLQKQDIRLVLNILLAIMRCFALTVSYYLSKNVLVVLASFVTVNSLFEIISMAICFYFAREVKEVG